VVALNDMSLNGHAAPAVDSWARPEPDRFDDERARLEAEIASAKERAAEAKARAAARECEVRVALRAEVVASRGSLAEMKRRHDATITTVRAAAQADVERILAEARRLAGDRSGPALRRAGVNGAD
jgi:uncharacterized membrane protein YqiK